MKEWHIESRDPLQIVDQDGYEVARVNRPGKGFSVYETDEIARQIAALPDAYEALLKARTALAGCAGEPCCDESTITEVDHALKKAGLL